MAYYITSGKTSNGLRVVNNDMYISSGGIANSTNVEYNGCVHILNGGVANNTTTDYGYIEVSSGGVANSTTLGNVGGMYIYQGGVHKGTLRIGSVVSAYSGAKIDFTIAGRKTTDSYLINNLSKIKGAPTYSITIKPDQSAGTYKLAQHASSFSGSITIGDGSVNYGSIKVNGEDFIYDNKIYSLDITDYRNGGNLTLSIAEALPVLIYSSGTLTSSGTTIMGANIVAGANDKMCILSGGVASKSTVSSGGRMLISSGGIANSTTLLSGAYSNNAYSGATINDMTIHSGARIYISGSDVNATGLVIKEGGIVDVDVRPYLSNVNISGTYEIYGDFYVRNGSASGFVVSSGDAFYINSGGFAQKTTINGGSMGIQTSASATETTVNSTARMNVALNANATNTTVNNGGRMIVLGIADSASVNSGGLIEVSSGGMLQNAIIEQGHANDSIVVSEGGSANNVLVKNGGDFRLYGGFASDVILSGGAEKDKSDLFLLQGGSVCNVSADILGVINISSGIAEKVKVLSGGKLVLHSSGAIAKDTTINSGGSVYISRGGIASNTTMAGRLDVDGIARGVTVLSGGYLKGRADAALSNTTVSSGGRAFLGGGGGTSAYNMIVKSGGYLEVDGSCGGSAQNAQFYGDQTFGGTVNIVRSDCKMDMQGKMITFAIEERKAGDAAIVNNLGYFTNAVYYVRISENQADGEYKLAQGANNFTGSITVGDGTLDYGTLTVNGDDLTYGGNIYSLNQVDGNLTFTIKDITPPDAPVASADVTTLTNGMVTVSAEFSSDSVVKEYSLNGREWSVYEKGIDLFENGKIYFRGQDAAGNVSDVTSFFVDNIDTVADSITDKYIFISSKYTNKINGKKQNGITLIYGTNAFASLKAAGDTSGKTVILLDSKNSGEYVNQGTVSGVVVIPTVKETDNSYSYKANSAPKGTLNLVADTGSTEFIRFATVNVTGATVGNITGGKESSTEDTKSAVDKKGTVTDTEKTSYTYNANGKFTALDGSAATVKGYATVNLTSATVTTLSGGNTKETFNSKLVDGKTKDQKTISTVNDSVAAGSVTLKNQADADTISGYSNVTLTDSTVGDITNFTSKDSQSETATYDEAKNTVTRKVTVTHTENTAGTLKATDAVELGDVTGFATVTLKNVSEAGDFSRVSEAGEKYSTVKETLNVKTSKDGSVSGTYNKTETFTRAGKFSATNSTAGDIENFSTVTLDGSAVGDISNFTTAKIVTKGTASWDDMIAYGRPADYDIDLTGWELTEIETESLNGSVTLKNGASASSITNFKSVTMTASKVGTIENVEKVTVNKGDSAIGSYAGTSGNDTVTIAKGAVLTANQIDLGAEGKDTLAINGTLILTGSADDLPLVEAAKITGKGEIAIIEDLFDDVSVDFANILNVGKTAENFRGTAYENADDSFKKAVKWDGKEEYNGWLGNWDGYTTGSDMADHIKFKADLGDELIVDGISNWTLLDKKGNDIGKEITAAGEYILKLENASYNESHAYTVTLA